MNNFFSVSTQPFFDKIYAISLDESDDVIEALYDELMDDLRIPISPQQEMELEAANTVEEIARKCFDIVYPLFRCPLLQYKTKHGAPLSQLFELYKISFQPEDDKLFITDVIYFLLLSFIYRQSCTSFFPPVHKKNIGTVLKCPNISELLLGNRLYKFHREKKSKESGEKRRKNTKKKPNYMKRYFRDIADKPRYDPSYFIEFFLPYHHKKRRDYDLSSWYDVMAFIGLTSSVISRYNPYMTADPEEDNCNCDMEFFLNYFNPLDLHFTKRSKNQNAVPNTTDKENDDNLDSNPLTAWSIGFTERIIETYLNDSSNSNRVKYNVKRDIVKSNFLFFPQVYQYIVERVTGINLINIIFRTVASYPELDKCRGLAHLAVYPLVRYRRYFVERMNMLSDDAKMIKLERVNEDIQRIISHHIFVAFPVLEVFFHLTLLKKKLYFKKIDSDILQSFNGEFCPLFKFSREEKEEEKKSKEELKKEVGNQKQSRVIIMKPCVPFPDTGTLKRRALYQKIVSRVISYIGTLSILGDKNPLSYKNVLQENSMFVMQSHNLALSAAIGLRNLSEYVHLGRKGKPPWNIVVFNHKECENELLDEIDKKYHSSNNPKSHS